MPNRTKKFIKILFMVIMIAAIFTQPVLAQDRCHANVTKVNGSCVYDGSSSTWQVKISLYGYKVTFQHDSTLTFENKGNYNQDFYTNLPSGTWVYNKWEWSGGVWVSKGTGSISLESCSLPHSSASVEVETCYPGEPGSPSSSDVVITSVGADVTINGVTYGASTTIPLSPGNYSWSWVPQTGYWGTGGGGTLIVENCTPEEGTASVSLGTCYPGEPGTDSVSDVNISVNHATMVFDGDPYTESTTIQVGPGSYPWSWEADDGYTGGGEGTLEVGNCSPKLQAEVLFEVGACGWNGDEFERDVTLTIDGASVTIVGSGGTYGPYTSSQTIKLPCGDYTYSWSAVDPDYEGSGSGDLHLPECDQSKADAAANIGACSFADDESQTTVEIVVQNAIFTIDGNSYDESTTIKLAPGDYPYSWGPVSGQYSGSGEGILTVGSCEPKEEEDPSVDVAAGGSAPSLMGSLAPLMTLVIGAAFVWSVTEQTKARKTK